MKCNKALGNIVVDEAFITKLGDDFCGDSDGSWWIATQIEEACEVLIKHINESKYLNNEIVILKKKERDDDCSYPENEICPVCEWEERK